LGTAAGFFFVSFRIVGMAQRQIDEIDWEIQLWVGTGASPLKDPTKQQCSIPQGPTGAKKRKESPTKRPPSGTVTSNHSNATAVWRLHAAVG
jgi:hypothetical protein